MALRDDVDGDAGHLDAQHFLQADRLGGGLDDQRPQVTATSTPLVLDRHEHAVPRLLNRVCDPVKPVPLADNRHSPVHAHTSAVVDARKVDPVMCGAALDGEMIVCPYAVLEQPCLPRAICVVLQGGQGQPVVVRDHTSR